jgi:hypothetical protein
MATLAPQTIKMHEDFHGREIFLRVLNFHRQCRGFMYSDFMVPEIKPWLKYPDLTEQRLSIVANEIRRVRSDCVALHKPEDGDGDWSLGCRVYQRTFFAIQQLAKVHPWLTIIPELKALQFSFCVGSVPLRFYKGDPDDPPSRYLMQSPGEIEQIQLCLSFEGRPTVDTILRLAVDVDVMRQASSISMSEINEFKEVIGKYRIPFEALATNITPMQAPPVNLPPLVAEPIDHATDAKNNREKAINAGAK